MSSSDNAIEGVLQAGDWIETKNEQLFIVLNVSLDQDDRRVMLLGAEKGHVCWKHEQTLHRWGVSLAAPPMALQFEMEVEEPT